ncbi:hypothetical protein YC2023_054677 [Brassica napus]
MYASPLSIMRLVTKTKSVEYMSFFLSLFVFLCGTSWFIYDLIGCDPFVAEKKSTDAEKDEKKTVEMKDEEKKQNVVYGKQQEQQRKLVSSRVEFMLLQCDEAMSVLDEKAFRIGGK